MADISKIKTLDGTEYDVKAIRSNSVPIATVDSTSTSTAFTVQVPEFSNEEELRDGLFFYIYNNVIASASGWTLKVNNFDSKPVYNSTLSRTTTGFAVNKLFPIWYDSTLVDGGCWIIGYLSDTNTTYSTFSVLNRGSGYGFLADSTIYRYQMLFQIDEDTVTPLNNVSNSTATSKTMLTDVEFDPFGEVFHYSTTTTVAAGSRVDAASCNYTASFNLRYTFNCGTTLTAYAPFYLKLSPQQNGKVKIANASPWAQALPSTNDGYYYMYLGRTYSTYQLTLHPEHPIYYHDGTGIKELLRPGTVASEASIVNGHTVNADVPSNAVFTDTITYVKGDAESSYHSGNVNLTPANIGSYSKSEIDTMIGDIESIISDLRNEAQD